MKSKLIEYQEHIIDLYKSKNVNEIAKIYNCYPQVIINLLKRNSVYIKSPNKGNIRYFQNIDNELKAYFLGFICADGCIQYFTKSSCGLSITLDIKDKCILDKLKEEIGNEHSIRVWSRPQSRNKEVISTYCRFQIADINLFNDIKSYGITERKSMTLDNSIINNISKEFRKYFILGYFDGDGCVINPTRTITKKDKIYPNRTIIISIRGTKSFLEAIVKELEINYYSIIFSKQYSLQISKKVEVLKFYSCYDKAPFYLERKYNKFQERLNHISFQRILQVQTISLPSNV